MMTWRRSGTVRGGGVAAIRQSWDPLLGRRSQRLLSQSARPHEARLLGDKILLRIGGSENLMSAEPIDVVRQFCAAWTWADADALLAFMTPDAIFHNVPI